MNHVSTLRRFGCQISGIEPSPNAAWPSDAEKTYHRTFHSLALLDSPGADSNLSAADLQVCQSAWLGHLGWICCIHGSSMGAMLGLYIHQILQSRGGEQYSLLSAGVIITGTMLCPLGLRSLVCNTSPPPGPRFAINPETHAPKEARTAEGGLFL